jgi:plasmid maintenance system killer protein
VTGRIADLRVSQAQRHGIVVGLPRVTAQRIAALADFLGAAGDWRDLAVMFDELERHERTGWKVPVDGSWWLAFDWTEGVGAVNVRLVE